MKDIEEIKQEIRDLIDDAADQGVMIEQISAYFIGTVDGRGAVAHIEIREKRTK